MPRDHVEDCCQCCGNSEQDISEQARRLGARITNRQVKSFPGEYFLGNLTLCTWCENAIRDELQDPLKEQLMVFDCGIRSAVEVLNAALHGVQPTAPPEGPLARLRHCWLALTETQRAERLLEGYNPEVHGDDGWTRWSDGPDEDIDTAITLLTREV